MPSGRRSTKLNGHNGRKETEKVIHLRIPAELNRQLVKLHNLQTGQWKTTFECEGDEAIGVRLRMPESAFRKLLALQADRSTAERRWLSRNSLIIDIVRERTERTHAELKKARSEGRLPSFKEKLKSQLYRNSERDKLSRNAMIIKMIEDTANER